MRFILKDVRCFEGRKEFNIRPITFLLGENSTGKSTVLGCFQALSDYMFSGRGIDFNNEPYQMGAFVDMARKTRSSDQNFELGFENIGGIDCHLILTERKDGSEPVIQEIRLDLENGGKITIKVNKKKIDKSKDFQVTESGENNFCISLDEDSDDYYLLRPQGIEFMYISMYFLDRKNSKMSPAEKNLLRFLRRIRRTGENFERASQSFSFAPIRSKPARTYNSLKESVSSEGSEMPMILMNLSASKERDWEDLKKQLEDFGKSSGLFSEISVRKLGSSMSDPFQLQITVRGSKANLMDVGYGISQVLPILVRIFISKSAKFLLQQPEVHLHPRAQAELASLLIDISRKQEKSFIIETHSDYMLKRARIEIMQKNIKPEDVSLIYLEPVGDKVEVHNIGFDDQANMLNVPESYGDFFLQERNRFLGFED